MADRALPAPALLTVVGLAGAGTMTVELAAVRLLAPWFGASSGVWTNVIGVVLLALALGYLVGARLSRGADPWRSLGAVLLLGAALTAWLPWAAGPVARLFMPSGVALDEAADLFVWGSLATALLLFLPSALVLGAAGPLAVELLVRETRLHAGEAGGRVLAASTIGSLGGTFGTTHLFLPRFGLTLTFLAAGAVLGALGAVVLLRVRRPALGGLLLLAALVWSRHVGPAVDGEWTLRAERQSPYQSIRVVERGAGPDVERWLQVNESFDSFQSVWQPEPGLLARRGLYYNAFALPPWWAGARGTWRMLVLGLGAGTTVRVLAGALPAGAVLDSTGVEIDPAVVELGARWFDLERGPGRAVLAGLDARAALQVARGPYDEVVLDTYANNMEVPAHLSTVEFFRALRDVLAPGGWLVVNAAGFGLDDPVVAALARTAARGMQSDVLLVRVPLSRNCVFFARRDADLPRPGSAAWRVGAGALAELSASLEIPGAWRVVGADAAGLVLTDDRNPIDRLQLASIAEGRRRWLEETP
jgi:spermidine synthase